MLLSFSVAKCRREQRTLCGRPEDEPPTNLRETGSVVPGGGRSFSPGRWAELQAEVGGAVGQGGGWGCGGPRRWEEPESAPFSAVRQTWQHTYYEAAPEAVPLKLYRLTQMGVEAGQGERRGMSGWREGTDP